MPFEMWKISKDEKLIKNIINFFRGISLGHFLNLKSEIFGRILIRDYYLSELGSKLLKNEKNWELQ